MATKRSERVRRTRGGAGAALVAAALLTAGAAAAQTQVGSATLSGETEIGVRGVWGDLDSAKFQEYRDLRSVMGVGSFDLLLENQEGTHWLRGRGENTGYRDQRYRLEGGHYGRYEIDLFYGELPHIFSDDARTPYVRTGDNSFALPDDFDIFDPGASPFFPVDQELRWQEGRVGAKYHVGEALLLRGSYRIQDKHGRRNWGMNFGSPGGSFTSIPARVSERIHEARAGADWRFDGGSFSVEYLGNFYDNDYTSVTANDALDPTAEGRAATAPNNWAQSLSLSGAGSLPLGVKNRVSASFVYGYRYQDEDFLDHTINPDPIYDVPQLDLPDSGLDAQVQTLLGNVFASVQPLENLSAKLRYRIYDFNNKTDSLLFFGNVRNDGGAPRIGLDNERRSVHNDYTRQDADLDVAWDFARSWTGVLGFGFEYWDRSDDREVEHLYDYGPRLKLDYRTLDGTLLHAGYEFRNRYGSNYNALAPLEATRQPGASLGGPDPLDPCFENRDKFCKVRKFDEADRFLHRFDLLAQLMPTELLELTFSGDVDYSDYRRTDFGLTEGLGWHVGTDAYYQLHERVGLLAYYSYQSQRLWQESRQRSPNFPGVEGPDWKSNTRYAYHNAGATLRLALLPDKLDADLGYVFQNGREKTSASGAGAPDLPSVRDNLQAVHGTVSWHMNERVTLRGGYRWEKYNIKNFHQDNIPTDLVNLSTPFGLYLGDVGDDYTAHIFGMSAVLHF